MTEIKMKVEIWSDIACPFCYIGKRNFETALSKFPSKDKVEVVWRSFQLMPEAKFEPGMDNNKALAEHLHTTEAQAKMMNERVTAMAKNAGLTYNMDILVWANTFNAHRLIQYAKTAGMSDQLEERLFQAHFTNGENLEDHNTLIRIAVEAGLEEKTAREILASHGYAAEVRADILEAQNLGLRGVPSYVVDRKVSFSGAVPIADFTRVLQTTFTNWEKEHSTEGIVQGAACMDEGMCK